MHSLKTLPIIELNTTRRSVIDIHLPETIPVYCPTPHALMSNTGFVLTLSDPHSAQHSTAQHTTHLPRKAGCTPHRTLAPLSHTHTRSQGCNKQRLEQTNAPCQVQGQGKECGCWCCWQHMAAAKQQQLDSPCMFTNAWQPNSGKNNIN